MPLRQGAARIDDHRVEITQRTEAGESCEQVAAALRAQGVETSSKTISRYRVAWGLRKRAAGTTGRKYPNRKRREPIPSVRGLKLSKNKAQEQRKAEITERTQRGESAEEIATVLQAQGVQLKSGASTIWRLQTTWGLIPYDKNRARGKGIYNKKKQNQAVADVANHNGTSSGRRRENLAPSRPAETFHYPSACTYGPQEGAAVAAEPSQNIFDYPDPIIDYLQSDGAMMHPPTNTAVAAPVNVAAQLMSADFLVDLASSTLAAANRIKELYLAQHAGRPAPGSKTGLPPTDEDIAQAKLKIREAAAVMHDLALPNPSI